MTKEKPAPKKQPEPFNPIDDLYGDVNKPVDTDLDLDKGKVSEPPGKH